MKNLTLYIPIQSPFCLLTGVLRYFICSKDIQLLKPVQIYVHFHG